MIRIIIVFFTVVGTNCACDYWTYKPSWKCALNKSYRVEMQVCDQDFFLADCQWPTNCNSLDGNICRAEAKGFSCGMESDPYEVTLWVRHTCTENGALTDWIASEEDNVSKGQVNKGEPLITFSGKYELSTLEKGFSKI